MFSTSSALLSSARRLITSRTSWSLPDIRRQSGGSFGLGSGTDRSRDNSGGGGGGAANMNTLQQVARLAQRELGDASSHRRGHSHQADAQAALLSRPDGRRSRLEDPKATFHYKRQRSRMQFNTAAFRKRYNNS